MQKIQSSLAMGQKFFLRTTYMHFKDINVGDFVFVRLYDLEHVFMWMGRVKNNILKDENDEFFRRLKVQ
jgi:hypothetical protein